MTSDDAVAAMTSSADLVVRGGRRRLDAQVSAGSLTRVHRGWYAQSAELDRLFAEGRHRTLVLSVQRCMRGGRAVFSHISAAVLWGLPLFRVRVDRVHLTMLDGVEPHSSLSVVRHRDALTEADVTFRGGARCTSLERTAIDVARTSPFEAGLCAMDAAMRAVAWDDATRRYDMDIAAAFRSGIHERLARMTGRRGVRVARWIAEFADGRAQLPGESVSRLRLSELGFAAPRLQVPIPAPSGFYFVDFGLDDVAVWGEFDGLAKYTDPTMLAGRATADVLLAEKHREDWIRGTTGRPLVRWGMEDVASAGTLGRRLASFGIHPPR